MLSGHTFLQSRTVIYENHEDASAFESLWYHADAPGHAGKGVVLLPKGWKIAPAAGTYRWTTFRWTWPNRAMYQPESFSELFR